MDTFKEYLLSKYFSSFGYVVAAFHVPALVTFAAVTGQLRTSERRTNLVPRVSLLPAPARERETLGEAGHVAPKIWVLDTISR